MAAPVRNGLKWTYFDDDVLPAWVAEMDFGLAPSVSEALHAAVSSGQTGYPYPGLIESTHAAATEFWADWLGWSVEPSRVMAAPDVVEGARRVIMHLTRQGSPVVLPTPAYFPFFGMVERAGREVMTVRSVTDEAGRHSLDLAGVERAFDAGAGSIVLCNPWNPTGTSFRSDELSAIISLARSYNARVISDEIHAPLTYPGVASHTVAASVDGDVCVTVTSASKSWNLPGLKCAQVVLTNDNDLDHWTDYFTLEKVGVGTFGLIASEAAYRDGRDWLRDVLSQLEANRKLLAEMMPALMPKVGFRPPDATYLAWLDFTAHGLEDPAAHCLDSGRVGLTGGIPFGPGGECHARLNFGTNQEILQEAIERVAGSLG